MFNILVVEDDKNTRKLLSAILSNNGYNVLTATDGEDALSVLEHSHVDLMVIDVMMPKMDGYELTATLRDAGSQIPMLMLSAKQQVADIKQGFLVGIDDYLTKPFDFEELLLRIKALLRRSKIAGERKLTVGDIKRAPPNRWQYRAGLQILYSYNPRVHRNVATKGIFATVQVAFLP